MGTLTMAGQSQLGMRAFSGFADRGRQPARVALQRLEDRQLLLMQKAFAPYGGLETGDEVSRRLRRRFDQPISCLARWIVERRILSIAWESQTLIPVFQFDLSDMSRRACVSLPLAELATVFDDWDLTLWFAEPNAFLRESTPVDDLMRGACEGVFQAARADRFVARG